MTRSILEKARSADLRPQSSAGKRLRVIIDRARDFFELPPRHADGTVQRLDGDELATMEAGWRETAGRWSLDLSLYHSWWDDVQSDGLLKNGLTETVNVGRAAISGAELTIKGRFAGGWRLEAGAMAQSALLVRNETGLKLDDRRAPVVPTWTFRTLRAHDFALADWSATLTADARYVGPSRLSFDPALDRPMGNYVQFDAGLAASRGQWTIGPDAENLFDATVMAGVADDGTVERATPQTFWIGVRFE